MKETRMEIEDRVLREVKDCIDKKDHSSFERMMNLDIPFHTDITKATEDSIISLNLETIEPWVFESDSSEIKEIFEIKYELETGRLVNSPLEKRRLDIKGKHLKRRFRGIKNG